MPTHWCNVGVQSGSIAIWGVQLEIGSVATPLEKPDPQQDLAKCQRFYQTLVNLAVRPQRQRSATHCHIDELFPSVDARHADRDVLPQRVNAARPSSAFALMVYSAATQRATADQQWLRAQLYIQRYRRTSKETDNGKRISAGIYNNGAPIQIV